jgi:hypothetical protein
MIIGGLLVVFKFNNSHYYRSHFKPTIMMASLSAIMFVLSLFGLNRVSDFIYFNF